LRIEARFASQLRGRHRRRDRTPKTQGNNEKEQVFHEFKNK
jgi:hypothetical protein